MTNPHAEKPSPAHAGAHSPANPVTDSDLTRAVPASHGQPRRTRPTTQHAARTVAVVILLAGFLLGSLFFKIVQQPPRPTPGLAGILRADELVAITLISPTTVYSIDGQWSGFDYDLIRAFAAHLGVDLRLHFVTGLDALMRAVRDGAGQVAIAGLTPAESRRGAGSFSSAYLPVEVLVVCAREGPRPESNAALADVRLAIPADSRYSELLEALKHDIPALEWAEVPSVATEGLFVAIADGAIDCTLSDSNIFRVNARFHPQIRRAFTLEADDALAVLVPEPTMLADAASTGPGLLARLNEWLALPETRAYLEQLDERYYGHLKPFDYVEVARFHRRLQTRLPAYRALFEAAGARYGIPWTLLAAQSYQESNWDPAARSPTGVAGIMMLTQATAGELGVADRQDPAQAIPAGARYLARLYERLPAGLTGEDRLWAALAAYNIGYGHLLDARVLAERAGEDKNSWRALRRALPKLDQPAFYRTVKRGRARGRGAVTYVDRIREFHAILDQMLQNPSPAPDSVRVRLSSDH